MATCPNCKADLMEVNGRYICSQCGKEVPAGEINVGTWGDPVQEAAAAPQDDQAGGSSVYVASDDYIEGEVEDQQVPSTLQEQPANETPSQTSGEINIQPEEGFYTSESNLGVADPVTEDAPEPQVEEPAAANTSQEPSVPAVLDEAVTAEVSAPSVEDVVPVNEAEVPVQNSVIEDSSPVQQPVETPVFSSVAPPDPLYPGGESAQPAGSVPSASDFYSTPQPQEDEIKEPLASGAAALPQDSGIYRDPMYDAGTEAAAPAGDSQSKESAVSVPSEVKTNRLIIVSGIAAAAVLVIIGVIAFIYFGSNSKVNTDTGTVASAETNCDNEKTDTGKAACVAKAFSACTVAKWTGSYPGTESGQTRTVQYEIEGAQDSQCLVDLTMVADTTSTDTVGNTMACAYDSSLGFDAAVSGTAVENCSGDLADIIFGTTTSEDTSVDTADTTTETETTDDTSN